MAGAETGALSPVPRTPLYERLVERLRTHVLQADAGDRLQPERELAARLGVSRSSVRQAIVALQVRGLVEVRHGGGTFLRGDDLDPAPSARILDLQRRLPDILDAREALAVKLAELAAERRTDADLQAIHAALAVMADQVEQSTPGEAGDEAFQHCITAAAHSSVLAQMSADLAQDIGASRHESPSRSNHIIKLSRGYERGTPSTVLQPISTDKALRAALFMAADQARKTDPTLAARYWRLRAANKHHNSVYTPSPPSWSPASPRAGTAKRITP